MTAVIIDPLPYMHFFFFLSTHRTHSLKVTIDTTQRALANVEVERDILKDQMLVLQDNLASLKRDNEKAKEMRSLALEERSKVSS